MSKLQVDDIVNKDDTGSVGFSRGVVVTGVMTATTFSGNGSALTGVASTDNIITGTAATFTSDVNIADSIIHVGDTNTKIRFPSADTFSVETGGTEAYRVDSSRRILLGHTSSRAIGHASGDGKLQIEGTNLGTSELSIVRNSDNNGAAHIFIGKSRGSSVGDSTVVQDDDTLGIIGFAGADGTDLQTRAAQIECAVDGTPGGNDMPGRLVFSTTADGASSVTERLRIDSSGRLLINHNTARTDFFQSTGLNALINVEGTNNATRATSFVYNSNDAGQHLFVLGKSRGTSVGSNTIVQNNDNFGGISFHGADGSKLVEGARIEGEVDGTPGSDDMPGRLVFMTTADGAAATTERMRIDSNGKTGINISNPGDYNSSGNELVLGNTGSNAGMTIVSNSSNNGHIFFADGTASGAQNRGIIKYEHGNDAMAFNTAETERLRLTSGGDLLVGHGSVITNMKFGGSGDFGSHAEIVGANKGFANGLAILNYDASATIPAILKLATSRNDTAGSNTIVGNSGDNCASIQFMGNDGTRFIDLARIDGVTDGTVGGNDMPGRLSFHTTADGASVVTERMRIHSGGVVSFNNGIELGSGLDATAANTLDDYEEGTFTPTANGFTVSGTTTVTGKYVKIGQLVTIGIKFANTGTIAHGVSCNIASLPFSMAAGTEAHGLIGMLQNSNSTSFNSNIAGTQCKLDGEGGSRFFVGSFTTTSSGMQLLFGGSYISNT